MFRSSGRLFAALTVLALLALPSLALAQDATLEATLTYVGPGPGMTSIYRYDYTLTNNSVTPQIIELIVFFDSDPDSGVLFLGDYSDFNNTPGFGGITAAPSGWIADVFEDPDPAAWAVDFFNASGGNVILPGASLGGFSVTFLWKGTGYPGEQFFEALDGFAHEGRSTVVDIVFPPITGRVTSECDGRALAGVPVDLYLNGTTLFATTFTNAEGYYTFASVPPGNYVISIAPPLGYQDPGEVAVSPGQPLDFVLECIPICNDPRTIGFWKHQVNVYLTGKGKAQVTKAALVGYLNAITQHFAESPVHPVLVYTVPVTAPELTKLQTAQQILTVDKGTMEQRARQQLMALLLNVASLKLAQSDRVSADNATVSQAITYCWDLIADGNPANDETAKTIADEINNGRLLPAGWVPLGTPNYAYREPGVAIRELPGEPRLMPAFPNPVGAAGAQIRFVTARDGATRLDLFDVQGRRVRTLVDGELPAGEHSVAWDGRDDAGQRVASGLYFYRLRDGDVSTTRTLVVAD